MVRHRTPGSTLNWLEPRSWDIAVRLRGANTTLAVEEGWTDDAWSNEEQDPSRCGGEAFSLSSSRHGSCSAEELIRQYIEWQGNDNALARVDVEKPLDSAVKPELLNMRLPPVRRALLVVDMSQRDWDRVHINCPSFYSEGQHSPWVLDLLQGGKGCFVTTIKRLARECNFISEIDARWTAQDEASSLIPELQELGLQHCAKYHMSAFAVPSELESILRRDGIEEVVITGIYTEGCVTGTAQDVAAAGFRTRVISDCTFAFDGLDVHLESLHKMQDANGISCCSSAEYLQEIRKSSMSHEWPWNAMDSREILAGYNTAMVCPPPPGMLL